MFVTLSHRKPSTHLCLIPFYNTLHHKFSIQPVTCLFFYRYFRETYNKLRQLCSLHCQLLCRLWSKKNLQKRSLLLTDPGSITNGICLYGTNISKFHRSFILKGIDTGFKINLIPGFISFGIVVFVFIFIFLVHV